MNGMKHFPTCCYWKIKKFCWVTVTPHDAITTHFVMFYSSLTERDFDACSCILWSSPHFILTNRQSKRYVCLHVVERMETFFYFLLFIAVAAGMITAQCELNAGAYWNSLNRQVPLVKHSFYLTVSSNPGADPVRGTWIREMWRENAVNHHWPAHCSAQHCIQ